MSKEKENKIEELLTQLCRWAKNNCNGGRVFQNDVKAKVCDVMNDIKTIIRES